MVFQGYQIPKKNLDARLKNLSLGLKNNALLYANSTLRLRAIDEIKKEADKITVSTQTNADPNALVDLATMTQSSVNDIEPDASLDTLALKRKISGNISEPVSESVSETDSFVTAISDPKEMAIKSALESAKNQALKEGKVLTKEEERNIIENVNKQSNVLSGLNLAKPLRPASTFPSTVNSQGTTLTIDSYLSDPSLESKLSDEQKISIDIYKLFKDTTNKDYFMSLLDRLKTKKVSKVSNNYYKGFNKLSNGVVKSVGISPSLSENKKLQMWDYFKDNKDNYLKRLEREIISSYGGTWGSGLMGVSVKPYYSDYRANFGNLYLSEKSLKKNNLTIYRPKSKIQVIAKKNISPLLKKMILDIQNTLEFDTDDYNNLEADEKRIIERIIRLEKDMKDYNIKKLIDDDEVKIKKRLEILTAQVNAGNNSALVREEMKYLVKQLFKNNAISQGKYNNVVKSIDALAN